MMVAGAKSAVMLENQESRPTDVRGNLPKDVRSGRKSLQLYVPIFR